LPALRQVVVARLESRASSEIAIPPVLPLSQWLSPPAGAAVASTSAPAPPTEDDLAALVYTSGTTGKPKGVMLTHANVVANVNAVLERVAPLASDVFLSFLPLSHTFERTGGYYLPIAAGACVAYARSVALLAEDLKTVRPTILISVPRIYERVHGKLQEMLAASRPKSRLFEWAEAVGWRRFFRQQSLPLQGGGWRVLDDLAWRLLEPLVARPLLAQFGGQLRVAVSGGAPLSQPIARCFLGLGLPILQGYGMTETSPVVAVNAPDDNDPATVGRPLDGVQVRIGENLELQVRGPSVMRGYWKREEDSARAFIEGWLRTGDQAAIVAGRIRILGRLKEIIVTSTGEKIAPADLELAITADALFEQAYVFGDNRPFIACIVVLNRTEWARLAESLHLDASLPASLDDGAARAAALARIRSLTHSFPYYAQPRAVCLTLEPWTPENTLMTPTLKIKRNNLGARFAAQIVALYQR
jgi:long-chain acyl-CoA synthetase